MSSACTCYLIHTHQNPTQVLRLVAAIVRLSTSCYVIVSHDAKGAHLPIEQLESLGPVHVQTVKGGRGSFAHIQAYLTAVRWLQNKRISFDWLINMSGQDYPLSPLADLESRLARSGVDGFIEHFAVFSPNSPWGLYVGKKRYLYHYVRFDRLDRAVKPVLTCAMPINRCQPLVRIETQLGMQIGVRARSPFGPGWECYGGSAWSALSASCVAYIEEYSRTHVSLVDYFRRTLSPDESLFQTVLVNSGLFRLDNQSLHFTDFSTGRHSGRPRVLTRADLVTILASGKAFARKFDATSDAAVLDELDVSLGLRSSP